MKAMFATVAFGLALLCTPAQAATILITRRPTAGNPYPLVAGNIYIGAQTFLPGNSRSLREYVPRSRIAHRRYLAGLRRPSLLNSATLI